MTERSNGQPSQRQVIIKGLFAVCVAMILAFGLYVHGAAKRTSQYQWKVAQGASSRGFYYDVLVFEPATGKVYKAYRLSRGEMVLLLDPSLVPQEARPEPPSEERKPRL